MDSLDGKVFALMGARGLGLAVAKALYARGANISIADISSSTLAHAQRKIKATRVLTNTSASASASTGTSTGTTATPESRIMATTVDIGDSAAVNQWITATVERFGPLDGAVNIAGVIGPNHTAGAARYAKFPDDDCDLLTRANVAGMMYCIRAQVQSMRATRPRKRACVVTVADMEGFHGNLLGLVRSGLARGIMALSETYARAGGEHVKVVGLVPELVSDLPVSQSMLLRGHLPEMVLFDNMDVAPHIEREYELVERVLAMVSGAYPIATGRVLCIRGGWWF